jgi:hypothetical protein
MQNTDLSLQPYFDDFNENKNFYRVLFKPNYPVQARELTTLQSILQNQIEKFGQHVFKEGSVVIPGQAGYDLQHYAILIQSTVGTTSFEDIRENLTGTIIRGLTSNVTAKVLSSISATDSEKSTATLYVKYISSGNIVNGTQLTKFSNNETLVDSSDNPVAVTATQNATNFTGSAAFITEGVYFLRGFFVNVPSQTIILDQYSNFPSYKIGLSVTEIIVNADTDSSLYDNAVGSSNFTAPGADRLKIEAVLSKQDINFAADSTFIELLRLEEGKLIQQTETSVYNELEKNLARRTYDESGNYTINTVNLRVKETYNNGENNGVYSINDVLPDGKKILNRTPTAQDGDAIDATNYYTIELDPLKSYVKGFQVENTSKKYLTIEKPRKFSSINNQGALASFGNYLRLNASTIVNGVLPGVTLVLNKTVGSTETQIGKARVLSLIAGEKLFLADLTLFTTIVTTQPTPTVLTGDFVFSSNGAQAVVESISGNTIVLSQITGQFLSGSIISNSRDLNTYTISSVVDNKIENITDVKTSSGFSADVFLDEVSITGSSFTVNNNTLTGIGTAFTKDLKAPMKLRIGTSAVTISAVSSDTSVTVTGTIANGTYYNVKKLVPKLINSGTNFFTKFSNSVLKSVSDLSYYKTITETKIVTGSTVNISTTSDYTLSASDILVTNSSGTVEFTATIISSTSISLSVDSTLSGTSVVVVYKARVNNPTLKTKSANKFNFLSVTKSKNSTNTIYGTRISDNEISLKFSDVYRVHAIHEALASTDTNQTMFDSLVINSTTDLKEGDIITYENIRAKIISISGTTLYVIYLSADKFPQGTSLALSVNIISNSNISGKVVTASTYGKYKDITNNYVLVKNDSSEFYNISKLVKIQNRPVPTNKFIVVFDYYNHSNISNDFYSANSYDPTEVDYAEIPTAYDGTLYTDIVDFRYETTSSSGTGGSLTIPYQETASALNYYQLTRSISTFAFPGEVVSADYDYYLGRIDKIFLDENGNLVSIKGSETNNPQEPESIQNALLLATVTIPPYMKSASDAVLNIQQSKRYTMKDIGLIDRRLENVETLTSLNLLEIGTNSLNIVDDDGNNRFKTGFIVDNFKTTALANLNDVQYTASIDTANALLRPYPYVNNINLNYDSSSTTRKKGSLVTLPYTEVPYITQQYASRVENLQPFEVISWNGELILDPNKDVWFDTVRTQRETQQIDLASPIRFLFDNSGAAGEQWGGWTSTGSARTGGGTNVFQERAGVNNTFSSLTQEIQVGDSINSIVSDEFIRSRIVDLVATKLKPNTLFHFFVDDSLNDSMIFPKNITGISNRTGTFVVGETVTLRPEITTTVEGLNLITATVTTDILGSYTSTSTYLSIDDIVTTDGSNLNPVSLGSTFRITGNQSGATGIVTLTSPRIKANSVGTVNAFLIIPPNIYQTGTSVFKLCDEITGTSIYGISQSNAENIYDTIGARISLTSNVVSLDVPQITSSPIRGTRTVFVPDPPPPPPPRGGGGGRDPLAQSFLVDLEGGVFISSIDLYFQSKDSTIPVSVEIRTMENGTVTETVVPYSVSVVEAANVKVSANASVATRFTFPSPVYLNQDTYYAFMIKSDSTEYRVWISRLAETDILTSFVIDKQPYSGSLFKSQNMSTWTPDQFEDVKFVMNRAKFITNSTYTCKLKNDPIPSAVLNSDPLSFTNGSATIKVYHPNHCMNSTQNYVKLNSVSSDAPNTTLNTAITTASQTGNVTVGNATATTWKTINGSPVSATNPGYVLIGSEIMKYTSISGNTLTISERGVSGSLATVHAIGSIVKCYSINGIPLTEINKTHKITNVIDLDSYEIAATNTANSTAIAGGTSVTASRNIQYEELYPNINTLVLPSTDLSITFTSITGNSLYAPQISFAQVGEESVENKQYCELTTSRIVVSSANNSAYFPSTPSSLVFNLKLSTELDNISPIIDVTGSSAITVCNRISKKTLNGAVDISAELTPNSGTYSSYVTKKITLQNTSTSIKVLLDGVRKQGLNGTYSDIKVFAKINGDGNLGKFDDMDYIELPAISYPISTNSNDYRAFEFETKNLTEFKEYSIKICMISGDQTNIPKIRNFRAIALAV